MYDNIPQLELIRMAAFIDGEGSIVLGKCGNRARDLRLQLCNTDPRLILWAKELFGGTITKEEKSKTLRNTRNIFRWHVTGNKAAKLIEAIFPFLILKKEQAEVALAYRSTVGSAGMRLAPEVKQMRLNLSDKLSELKRVNYSVVDYSAIPHPLQNQLSN